MGQKLLPDQNVPLTAGLFYHRLPLGGLGRAIEWDSLGADLSGKVAVQFQHTRGVTMTT